MTLKLPNNRPLDAICLGRAGMDLYAQDYNTALTEVTGFNKHVGGSPANIAIGMAKLGSKLGFIGVVSDDAIGHYVLDTLQQYNIDTQHISQDSSGTRTSLAVTEMRPDNCAVVIYRNQAADLALSSEAIDVDYIASARLLIVSGTALSASPSREAVFTALLAAEQSQTPVVLDLDYRPYSWQSQAEASTCYTLAARFADIIIGNDEEFAVLQGITQNSPDDADASLESMAKNIAEHYFSHHKHTATHTLCVKGGHLGSTVINRQGEYFHQPIFAVAAKKPFGAGDAYAAALCTGLLEGRTLKESVQHGAAAAAIVVAGDSCGDASPTRQALDTFLKDTPCHNT